MRVFLYEYITGGGLLGSTAVTPPSGSLLREGAAMLNALAEDFGNVPAVQVSILRDVRLPPFAQQGVAQRIVRDASEHSERFDRAAAEADWTVVIAPEFDRILIDRVRRVEEVGGRLLGPAPWLAELGTFKAATLAHLAGEGIRTPRGCQIVARQTVPESMHFPVVIKPVDGAGSQGVSVIETRETFPAIRSGACWLEEFQEGIPVSVALLCGAERRIALPACQQLLSDDGRLRYLGGRLPINEPLRARAESLALAVADALPSFLGYVGIDMVLGAAEDSDCVIELNPRLTTSYVGLRQAARQNLAAAMLELAAEAAPELRFDLTPVEFSADGTVQSVRTGEAQTR